MSTAKNPLGLVSVMYNEFKKSQDFQRCGYLLGGLLDRLFRYHGMSIGKSLIPNYGAQQMYGSFDLTCVYKWKPLVEQDKNSYRSILQDFVKKHFNLEELRDICFRMSIDYEELPGQGKSGKVRELILYCERRGLFTELLETGKSLRLNLAWPDVPLAITRDQECRLEGRHYLIGCQWQQEPATIEDIARFDDEIRNSDVPALGLFLSIKGWSSIVPAFMKIGSQSPIVLVDDHDLHSVINDGVDLQAFIRAKTVKLVLAGESFYGVDQYVEDNQNIT